MGELFGMNDIRSHINTELTTEMALNRASMTFYQNKN